MKGKKILLGLGAVIALSGSIALAQQPPAGGAQPPPGGSPRAQPMPMPGQPGQPGMPPGMRRPGGMPGGMPGGHPPMPGTRPGGARPGLPPGFDPRNPGGRPRPRPRPPVVEEEHAKPHHCPGHGPDDAPPHVNYWHGILMANNERALKGGFVNQLLFRYENEKDHCDPKNEPPPLLASLINFGALAFILFRFGKKPLAEALKKRRDGIMADIDTATKLKEDAEARLEDYEEKIENIESKLDEVRAEYAQQAELERKHILAEAEERRVRMRKDAELRIEQELKAARAELLREAVVSAVAAAEDLVQKQIAARDQDKMANDYLQSIGQSLAGVR